MNPCDITITPTILMVARRLRAGVRSAVRDAPMSWETTVRVVCDMPEETTKASINALRPM